MTFKGYFLSEPPPNLQTTRLMFGDAEVVAPILTADRIRVLCDRLRANREAVLSKRPVSRLIELVDHVVSQWLDAENSIRKETEEALTHTTGLSRRMVSVGLTRMLEGYREKPLIEWLRSELGDITVLEGFHQGIHAVPPSLTAHLLAGNIPALGGPAVIGSLLLRSACLVKSPAAEPVFVAQFLRSIAEQDPEIGSCLAAVGWKGGDEPIENEVFGRADLVSAMGGEAAIADLKRRAGGRTSASGRLITHGHRVSFGLVARESLHDPLSIAEAAALDVAMYDQQGCLSPQLLYVETGGSVSPRDWAARLAEAMERLEERLPCGRIPPDAVSEIFQLRGVYQMRAAMKQDAAVWSSPNGTRWTVAYDSDPEFVLSPLYRTVRVKPLHSLSRLPDLVRPWRRYLSTVGLAAPHERYAEIGRQLAGLGVTRICPLGRMQSPPIGWHHDGRLPLREMLRWVDLERQ
jgi:hypothetical protein